MNDLPKSESNFAANMIFFENMTNKPSGKYESPINQPPKRIEFGSKLNTQPEGNSIEVTNEGENSNLIEESVIDETIMHWDNDEIEIESKKEEEKEEEKEEGGEKAGCDILNNVNPSHDHHSIEINNDIDGDNSKDSENGKRDHDHLEIIDKGGKCEKSNVDLVFSENKNKSTEENDIEFRLCLLKNMKKKNNKTPGLKSLKSDKIKFNDGDGDGDYNEKIAYNISMKNQQIRSIITCSAIGIWLSIMAIGVLLLLMSLSYLPTMKNTEDMMTKMKDNVTSSCPVYNDDMNYKYSNMITEINEIYNIKLTKRKLKKTILPEDFQLIQKEINRLKLNMDENLKKLKHDVEFDFVCGYDFITGPLIDQKYSQLNFNITDICAMYLPNYSFPKQPYFLFNNLTLNENRMQELNNKETVPTDVLESGKISYFFDYWEYCKISEDNEDDVERKTRFYILLNETDEREKGEYDVIDEIANLNLLIHPSNDLSRLASVPAKIYGHGKNTKTNEDIKSPHFTMVYDTGEALFENKSEKKFPASVKLPMEVAFALKTIKEEQELNRRWCL